MKVAMYDAIAGVDDVAAYRQLPGVDDVVLCTRFRPMPAFAPDADLVLTTYTTVPYTELPVVILGSDLRPVRHLPLVYRGPHWSRHAVAAWCLGQLVERADPLREVQVLGRGRISRLVRRWARRYWPGGVARMPGPQVGALVVLTPDSDPPFAADRYVLRCQQAVLISPAHGHPVHQDAVEWGLATGALAAAVIDCEPRWAPREGLYLTGHVAWRGHHTDRRRQAAVVRSIIHPLSLPRLRP